MRKLVILAAFMLASTAYANSYEPGWVTDGPGGGDQTTWNQYHASDRFDMIRNPYDVMHVVIGFGGAYLLSDVLANHLHLGKIETWVISTLAISAIGQVKETYIDNFAGKGDMMGWNLGATLGATTFLVVHF